MTVVLLPDAEFVGEFVNGSTEWHEARATAIGGSDVGTVLGVNGWKSPITLWFEKRGVISDHVEPNDSMTLGTLLEDPIRQMFEMKHPELRVVTTGTYASLANPRFHANPDACTRRLCVFKRTCFIRHANAINLKSVASSLR